MGIVKAIRALRRRDEDGPDARRLVRWGAFMSLGLVGLKIFFSLILVLFVMALWSWAQGETLPPALRWLRSALLPTAIIIGLVQVIAILACFIRAIKQNRKFCEGRALWASTRGFLRLLLFEWMVINGTSLLVSLSDFGLPTVGYNSDVAFAVTLTCAAFHYLLFVRDFTRRKSFVLWRFKDVIVICFPLIFTTIGAFGIILSRYIRFPLVQKLQQMFYVAIALLIFFFIGVPFIVYKGILIPAQQRAAKANRPAGAPQSVMEANIRRKVKAENVKRDELESLLLIGLDIDVLDGLRFSPRLRRLYLSCNKLKRLEGIEVLRELEDLYVDDNALASWHALVPLCSVTSLRNLRVDKNPFSAPGEQDVLRVVALLPALISVNGVKIKPGQRWQATCVYGRWADTVRCRFQRMTWLEAANLSAVPEIVHPVLTRRRLGWSTTASFARSASATSAHEPTRRALVHLNDYRRAALLPHHRARTIVRPAAVSAGGIDHSLTTHGTETYDSDMDDAELDLPIEDVCIRRGAIDIKDVVGLPSPTIPNADARSDDFHAVLRSSTPTVVTTADFIPRLPASRRLPVLRAAEPDGEEPVAAASSTAAGSSAAPPQLNRAPLHAGGHAHQ